MSGTRAAAAVPSVVIPLLLSLVSPAESVEIAWGVKAGFSSAEVLGDYESAIVVSVPNFGNVSGHLNDARRSFTAAGYGEVKLARRFGLRLELAYVQKGAKGEAFGVVDRERGGALDSAPYQSDLTLSLDYVEIPVLATMSIQLPARQDLVLFAGPALAINTGATFESDATGILLRDDELWRAVRLRE